MPTSPTRRVAIFGTFDVENYGDLLFPLIARQRLAPQGIDVVAVSPTATTTRYRDAAEPVSQADFARDPGRFDGILIGGGNIVHCRDFGLPGYGATTYPDLWAGATAHALRHGLPVIWNAPGVLAPRDSGPPPKWLTKAVAAANHFAVRDTASADGMERWSGRRPAVVPDTALDLPRVWPAWMLRERFAELRQQLGVPADGPVIALHVKERSLGSTTLFRFAALLASALEACGASAILVPIGRCHGDHDLAEAIHRAAPARTVPFVNETSLQDIAAVIAGADAYLGASLHGFITAAAYAAPARLVGVPALHKFGGQATLLDRVGDVVADWETALRDLRAVLSQPRRPLPPAVAVRLDAHWQAAARLISAGRHVPPRHDLFAALDPDSPLLDAARQPGKERKEMENATATERASGSGEKREGAGASPAAGWDGAAVDRMIAGSDLAAARERIAGMLGRDPTFLPARLAEVRLAIANGESALSVDLAQALSADWPANQWVWMCHLQCLAAHRQPEAALALFRQSHAEPWVDEAVMINAVNAVLALLPVRVQVALLQSALDRSPGNTALQLRLAMRAHAIGNHRLASDMLAKAERAGPLPPYAARVKNQLLPFQGSLEAAAEQLLAQAEDGATDVETLCRLCRFAAAAGRFDLSAAALRSTLDLHPLEWRTLYRLNRVFLEGAEDAEIFDRLAALAESAPAGPSWQLQYGLFALRAGQRDEGRRTLLRLSDAETVGPTARELLAALDALGPAAPRPSVVSDAHVRVVRRADARGTILVFGGMLGGLSHIHDRYLDALMAEFPANVIYLRDPHGRIYLQGIPELGPDEQSMHAALSRMIGELGGGTVITMGGSAAGYAALRAGLVVGADTVISLAGFATPGPTRADEPLHSRLGLEELFGGDPARYDLRGDLISHPDTRLVHVFGESHAPDLERARALEGIENARIHPMPGVDTHHVALPAIADGTLRRIIVGALAG